MIIHLYMVQCVSNLGFFGTYAKKKNTVFTLFQLAPSTIFLFAQADRKKKKTPLLDHCFSHFKWSNIKRKTSEHLLPACHFLQITFVKNFLCKVNWYNPPKSERHFHSFVNIIRPVMRVSDAKMNFPSILICIVSSWFLIALVGMFMSRLMLVICEWNDTLSRPNICQLWNWASSKDTLEWTVTTVFQ